MLFEIAAPPPPPPRPAAATPPRPAAPATTIPVAAIRHAQALEAATVKVGRIFIKLEYLKLVKIVLAATTRSNFTNYGY